MDLITHFNLHPFYPSSVNDLDLRNNWHQGWEEIPGKTKRTDLVTTGQRAVNNTSAALRFT